MKSVKAYPILGSFLAENRLQADETELKFYKEFGPVFGTYFNAKPVRFELKFFCLPQILFTVITVL